MGRHRAADASVELRRRRWRKILSTGLEGACGDRAARVLSAALIFRGSPEFPSDRDELEDFLRTELTAAAAAVMGHDDATDLVASLIRSIDDATGVARISLTQRRVRRSTPGTLSEVQAAAPSKRESEAPTSEKLGLSHPGPMSTSLAPSMRHARTSMTRTRQRSFRPSAQPVRRPVLILSASSFAARAIKLEHGDAVDVRHHYDPTMFEADFHALVQRNPIVLLDGRGRFRAFSRDFAGRCDSFVRCILWGFGADMSVGESMIPSVSSLTPEDLSMLVGRLLQSRG